MTAARARAVSGLAVLIPAAGSGRRMRGQDKLLRPIDGVPLLARTARRAIAACPRVMVALPAPPGPRGAALAGLGVCTVAVAGAAEGMAASLRIATAAACRSWSGLGGLMILPADMPEITAEDIRLMQACHAALPGAILRATSADGQPGHPVVLPRWCFGALAELRGDRGARGILRDHARHVTCVTLPGRHALTDLDTPEAWAAWDHARG